MIKANLAQARALVEKSLDDLIEGRGQIAAASDSEMIGSLRAILSAFDSIVSPQVKC